MTDQLLEILEKEHNSCVVNEGLDINRDPEKSYIAEKRNQLERLRAKRKERFSRLTGPQLLPLTPERFPGEDDLRSVCSNSRFSSASQLSKGPALLHRLKQNKSKAKAKIEAVEKVVNHPNIGQNPRVLTKARITWNQVDELRYQYESILDEAFETLGDKNQELAAELATNDARNSWIETVEAKLEEMLLMKDSPEKVNSTAHLELSQVHGQDNPANQAFNHQPPMLFTPPAGNMHRQLGQETPEEYI